MKGYDIYNRAMVLLGYSGSVGDPADEETFAAGSLEIINQILLDLGEWALASLTSEINAAPCIVDALVCGTAMLLSLTVGDDGKNGVFTQLYAAKRAKALRGISVTEDTLPIPELW